jgi:phospholipid/cholesterol/gamma-HCH transport system substrate-binding protein
MNERRLKARTHYIHRLSYSTQEKIAGAFVLVAIGVLAWLLFSSGKSIVMFEDQITLYGHLQTLQPINKDTDIIVGGLSAGTIEDVEITDDNKIIVTMRILKRYSSLLRTDSTAVLNTFNLAMFDKSVIEITVGSPDKPQLKDGSTIQIQESINIKNLLNRVTPAIDTLIRIVDNIDNILSAVDAAKVGDTVVKINQATSAVNAERIEAIVDNLYVVSNDLRDISEHLNTGKGLVGSALYDTEMENNVKHIAVNMDRASASLDKLLAMLNRELRNLPQIMEKIEPLMKEADDTIKATRRIWPISSAVGEEKEREKLTPQAPAND